MRKWQLVLGVITVMAFVLPACREAFAHTKAAAKPKAQESCGFVTNIYGQRLSWKGQVPVVLHLHESVPENVIPALKRALDTWAIILGRPIFQLAPERIKGPKGIETLKDGRNTIYYYQAGEWRDHRENQAKTYISWVHNEIKEADMLINAQDYHFSLAGFPKANEVDLESVFVHELGHVLGLDHEDQRTSVMATWLRDGETRRSIGSRDKEAVACEYM